MATNKKNSTTSASSVDKKVNKGRLEKPDSSLLRLYNALRYHVVPPFFVVVFTLAVQFLAYQANPKAPFDWNRFEPTFTQPINLFN